MSKSNHRLGAIRRCTERLLLLAGIAGIGLWAWSNALRIVSQDWDNWVFERELQHESGTAGAYLSQKEHEVAQKVEAWCRFLIAKSPDRSALASGQPGVHNFVRNKELVGRVSISRLNLSAVVREGVSKDVLGLAVGHIPGTATPGQGGNVGIAGHRDTLFRGLQNIQQGDVIRFQTLEAIYYYQVESTEVVTPEDVSVLKAGTHPELTLVTCYPFNYIGSAPGRFIVKARQLAETPQTSSASQLAASRPENIDQHASQSAPPPHAGRPTDRMNTGNLTFNLMPHHSQQLAPGISIGIDEIDAGAGTVNGWVWLIPDRRTVWLRHQSAEEPLVFYSEGRRRELILTKISRESVSGRVAAAPAHRFPPYHAELRHGLGTTDSIAALGGIQASSVLSGK
jgi:sortase A